jgi:hypothetical protein
MSDVIAEPRQIVAGDSIAWTRFLPNFPASLGWRLAYILVSQGKSPITIVAHPVEDAHQVSMAPDGTKGWASGTYRWTAMISREGERKTLDSGSIEILPDPATLTEAFDPRSFAERCLAAVEAALEGRLGDPLLEWEIAGRKVKDYPLDQLKELRRQFREEVRMERTGSPFVYFQTGLNRGW